MAKQVKLYRVHTGRHPSLEIIFASRVTDKMYINNGRFYSKNTRFHVVCDSIEEAFTELRKSYSKNIEAAMMKLEYALEQKMEAEQVIKSWQKY